MWRLPPLRKTHEPEQICITGELTKRVERGIIRKVDDMRIPLTIGLLKHLECPVCLSKPCIDARDKIRGDKSSL